MTDLREAWSTIEKRLRSASSVVILTDFDGTLVPLANRPDLVQLPHSIRATLSCLASLSNVSVGIVSGRALNDLVARMGVPKIWYVGNHGYEFQSPLGQEVRLYDHADVRYLDAVARELSHVIGDFPGVLLEPKGPVFALHYREMDPELLPQLEQEFLDVIQLHHDRVALTRGKCVLEAKLRGPHTKGTAVRTIVRESPPGSFPIYFGDDSSDHAAFLELRAEGLTISVGEAISFLAEYTLPGPQAVNQVLGGMLSILENK